MDEIQNCQDDSSGCYLYVSHTGFGGVAYAMAIIYYRLDAEVNFGTSNAQSLGDAHLHSTPEENLPSWTSEEEARRISDYCDILSLTRVLMYGPKSKANADTTIIERAFTR